MAKVVDITEKLSFEENSKLVIKGKELEINADAATVLKLMGTFGKGEGTPKQLAEMYDLLFPEKSKKEIGKQKLSFKDLAVIIQAAVSLAIGEGDEGEDQTHTTT